MKSHWMTHNGKKVFYADYSNLRLDELKVEVAAVEPVLCSMPKNSVLSLADVRGTYGTREVMDVLKTLTNKTKPHVHKRAVVGVTGVQTILLKALNSFTGQETVPFNDIESALDWLVKD
jgi:hypothetical protein